MHTKRDDFLEIAFEDIKNEDEGGFYTEMDYVIQSSNEEMEEFVKGNTKPIPNEYSDFIKSLSEKCCESKWVEDFLSHVVT